MAVDPTVDLGLACTVGVAAAEHAEAGDRVQRWWRGTLGIVTIVLAAGRFGDAVAQAVPPTPAVITRVDDGRTVWLEARGAPPAKVRLAWIALPTGPDGKAVSGPAAAEARRRLEVWKGQPVERVTVGSDPDGTPLVELLWRPTAESVITLNYEMVRSGHARANCSTSGPRALECRVLLRAEEVARQERRGMWAAMPSR